MILDTGTFQRATLKRWEREQGYPIPNRSPTAECIDTWESISSYHDYKLPDMQSIIKQYIYKVYTLHE